MTAHPLVAVSVLVGVSDPRVLEAVGSVPRAAFVPPRARGAGQPRQAAADPARTGDDAALARRVDGRGARARGIRTRAGDRNGLRLANRVTRPSRREVWSVERWDDLAEAARTHLARHGATNGYVAGGTEKGLSTRRAAEYVCQTQRPDGDWDEQHYTGTGFPLDFMIRYHLYRLTFPLLALGRLRERLNG
ncbi:MAG TPA: hypothetical protein VIM33_09500 [Gaiellaceae bacterium]